jgi:cytochrome P450
MHIIGAGFDTLGMTLASVLFWVAKTPGCQAKLQAELDKSRRDENLSRNQPEEREGVNGDEKWESNVLNYDAAIKLPYLQACITEAMRLTPTIGVSLPRTVPEDGCNILGTFLPADTVVGINPYIIQRSPEIFGSDAEEFRPERWIEANATKKLEMESVNLVFGGASRSCPGRNLAWMCASKAIAAIMERLNIEILADEEVKDIKGDKAGFREECFFKLQWYGIWVRMKERN